MDTVTRVRVRYAETDAMGIVYHANYLVWFEIARTELFRTIGIPYTRFEAEGLSLAVVDANIRYRSAAKYDDELDIKAELESINPRRVVFKYQVLNGGNIVCEGKTSHIFINSLGKATSAARNPIWQEVRNLLGNYFESRNGGI